MADIDFKMSIFVTLLALGEHSGGTDVAKLTILVAALTAGRQAKGLLRTTFILSRPSK